MHSSFDGFLIGRDETPNIPHNRSEWKSPSGVRASGEHRFFHGCTVQDVQLPCIKGLFFSRQRTGDYATLACNRAELKYVILLTQCIGKIFRVNFVRAGNVCEIASIHIAFFTNQSIFTCPVATIRIHRQIFHFRARQIQRYNLVRKQRARRAR